MGFVRLAYAVAPAARLKLARLARALLDDRAPSLLCLVQTRRRAVFNSSRAEAEQQAYRRGYYNGVSAVISGVFEKLSKEDIKKVEDWLRDPLVSWRDNGGQGPAPDFPKLDQKEETGTCR